MKKSKFRKQKNGRKRGVPGTGDGPVQETSPMGHGTVTPNKKEVEEKTEKKEKQKGWEND